LHVGDQFVADRRFQIESPLPSCTTNLGALNFPNTLAEGEARCAGWRSFSPLMSPATMIDAALIWAVTAALLPIKMLSLAEVSSQGAADMAAQVGL